MMTETGAVDTAAQYLVFAVGGRRFALDIRNVEEIVFMHPVVPVPLAPEFVGGIMNIRGRIVTLVHVERLVPGGESPPRPLTAAALLTIPDTALAVGLEEILGITNVAGGSVKEATVTEEGPVSIVKAVINIDDNPVEMLDMEGLISFLFGYDYVGGGVHGG